MAKKTIPENNLLLTPNADVDFNRDRTKVTNFWFHQLLIVALSMFEYEGLPETLNPRTIEMNLLFGGFACITEVDGKLYCLRATLGGREDVDYLPTIAIATSPALQFSKPLEIGKECVVVRNDLIYTGLRDYLNFYASQLGDLSITFRMIAVSDRTNVLLSASDDSAKRDAEEFLSKIEEGKLGVIGTKEFFDKALMANSFRATNAANIKDAIEAMQYMLAHFFIGLGLNDNYNMKREAVNESETEANEDTLTTLSEHLLKCRQDGFKEVNSLYGQNIKVKLSRSWQNVIDQMEAKEKIIEDEAKGEKPDEQKEETKNDDSTDK